MMIFPCKSTLHDLFELTRVIKYVAYEWVIEKTISYLVVYRLHYENVKELGGEGPLNVSVWRFEFLFRAQTMQDSNLDPEKVS
jgi:hypothetical protein